MKAYIGLGSNKGDREYYIKQALQMIRPEKVSSISETEPFEINSSDWFLNCVALLETDLKPLELLEYLENIEKKLGRVNKNKKTSRVIDLDLLIYEDMIVDLPNCKIPHPGIVKRRFVLEPLLELSPNLTIPSVEKTVKQLLYECKTNVASKPYIEKTK